MKKYSKLISVLGMGASILVPVIAEAKQYKGAEVYSSETTTYGKFVFRVKAAKGDGIISNFFTYKEGSEIQSNFWEEIDIEIFGKDNATGWQSNIITGHEPKQLSEGHHHQATSFADAYHTFTLEWAPTYVAWFVDGHEVRRDNNTGQVQSLTNEQSMRFNIWPPASVSWVGQLNSNNLPVHMFVNWFEFHKWNGSGFDFAWRDDFDTFDSNRWGKATWTFGENQSDFDPNNVGVHDGKLVLSLTHEGQTGFSGQAPVDPDEKVSIQDKDNDSIADASDNCPNIANTNQRDSDNDGLGDVCDNTPNGDDMDNDGVKDTSDNCPTIANPGQQDNDNDGLGNACDSTPDGPIIANPDRDKDGINNNSDNCPDIANPGQWDKDNDGQGNECDDDIDGDGFSNEWELANGTLPWQASSPGDGSKPDADKDGVEDDLDNCPNVSNNGQWDRDGDNIGNPCDDDIDGDGFTNADEITAGTRAWDKNDYPRDIKPDDVDGDGILNNVDNCPKKANPGQWDKDGDGIGNECDNDIDGDNFTNDEEIAANTLVWDATSFPIEGDNDKDNDGVINTKDNCPNTANPQQSNFDNDQQGDACDSDIDGDLVNNAQDECANTPLGSIVNDKGCVATTVELVDVRIQAEDYDRFSDDTAGNEGGELHSDDVDIEATTDSGNGHNIGWTSAGEWLEYDIDLAPATYNVFARVASEEGGDLSVSINGTKVSQSISATGGWQTWKTIQIGQVSTSSQEASVRVEFDNGGLNLNWIDIKVDCDSDPTCVDTDKDGVQDKNDSCPNTPAGVNVDDEGCEIIETAAITARQAADGMSTGFNLGQMFESNQHSRTFSAAKAKIDAYYAMGHRNVRIPVTWTGQIGGSTLVNTQTGVVDRGHSRLAEITKVIDYSLSLPDMYVVLNAHHEGNIKDGNQWRVLEQLWADVSDIFKDRSYRLVFEILNEPHLGDYSAMDPGNLRNMTGKAYDKIRANDQKRNIIIGGNQWFAANEMAITWPHLNEVGGGQDPHVMATFHHYNPWTFNGDNQGNYADNWTDHDLSSPMDLMADWANSVGNGMPVYIGEWGTGWQSTLPSMQCNNIRLWYQKFVSDYAGPKGQPTAVWDDGGWFGIFDHGTNNWNNNLAQCINGECDWTTNERFNSACF